MDVGLGVSFEVGLEEREWEWVDQFSKPRQTKYIVHLSRFRLRLISGSGLGSGL